MISGGADADPEVWRTYELAGAQVLNTGETGAIEFAVKRHIIGAKIWWSSLGR